MKKFGTPPRLTLCVSLLATIALSVPTSSQAVDPDPPSGLNVTVTNTPLPVQGTVGVSNFPATQPVSGTVNVGNFPATNNVNVTNTTPVPVTASGDPASNAFTTVGATGSATFGPFGLCVAILSEFPGGVPSGMRFVIENVSAEAILGTGQKLIDFGISTVTSGLSQWAPTYQADDGTNAFFVASQAMRFYVDAGNSVTMSAQASKLSDSGTCAFSFSGYLVNLR
jgi:hypothetical protein